MADNTAQISAISPELAQLVQRAKAIYELLGGPAGEAVSAEPKSFDDWRNRVVARTQNLDDMIDQRDHATLQARDRIRLSNQIRKEGKELFSDAEKMEAALQKDVRKGRVRCCYCAAGGALVLRRWLQ